MLGHPKKVIWWIYLIACTGVSFTYAREVYLGRERIRESLDGVQTERERPFSGHHGYYHK